jgi:hypothetical protein
LPVSRVDGDFRSLPIVNQLAVANASLGRTRAVAAFTRLDSEQAPVFDDPAQPAVVPLLARWDDRIVFSLPFAATMVRFSVAPDDLTIRPGHEIRLGARGPVIPVDLHGRTTVPALADPLPALGADELIDPDRKEEAMAPPDPAPLIVRDDRTRLTPDDKETSRRLADVLVALAAMPRGGNAVVLARPHTAVELSLLIAVALAGGALVGLRKDLSRVGALAGLIAGMPILLLLLARFHVWQPAIATCITPLAGSLTAAVQMFLRRDAVGTNSVLTTQAVPAPVPSATESPAPATAEPVVDSAGSVTAPKTPRKRATRKAPAPTEQAPPAKKRAAKKPVTPEDAAPVKPIKKKAAATKTTRKRKAAPGSAETDRNGLE